MREDATEGELKAMTDEQNSGYRETHGLDRFNRLPEDKSELAIAAFIGSTERSTAGHEELLEGERVPGPDSPGWCTVDRLTSLQSFR